MKKTISDLSAQLENKLSLDQQANIQNIKKYIKKILNIIMN